MTSPLIRPTIAGAAQAVLIGFEFQTLVNLRLEMVGADFEKLRAVGHLNQFKVIAGGDYFGATFADGFHPGYEAKTLGGHPAGAGFGGEENVEPFWGET